MPTLDTDVLVRFLVDDDPEQHAVARRCIESVDGSGTLLVPLTVALELEWVPRSRYGVARGVVMQIHVGPLEAREVVFQEEPSIERALGLHADHKADFADCLHLAIATTHERLPMITFDREASKMPGARRPGPG